MQGGIDNHVTKAIWQYTEVSYVQIVFQGMCRRILKELKPLSADFL